jgi:hypothetical protein
MTLAFGSLIVRSFEREKHNNMELETDTTTANQGNKRTRFNPELVTTDDQMEKPTPSTTKKTPPASLAESIIKSSIASLHPEIANIVERLGKEHITLLSKLDNKKKQHQRMNDDPDFIPRSARLDFKINVSKRAQTSAEFIKLDQDTKTEVDSCVDKLRALVIRATKVEITSIEGELKEHIVTSIRLIMKALMISKHDKSDVDIKVAAITQQHIDTFTVNATMTFKEFSALYKSIHGLDNYPPTIPTENLTLDEMDNSDSLVLTGLMASQYRAPPPVPTYVTEFKDLFENVFVSSWSQYKLQQDKNEIALELKKLSTSHFTERETANTVIAVDSEPSADKPELGNLVEQKARRNTNDLRQQFSRLQNEFNQLKASKNLNQRGHGGASNKKSIQPSTPTTTSKRSNTQYTPSQTQTTKGILKRNVTPKGNKAARNNNDSDDDRNASNKQRGANKSAKKSSVLSNKRTGQFTQSKQK